VLLGCVKASYFLALSFVPAFIASIYPNPELSSKDLASVVCCYSMGVLLIVVCRVRMACDGIAFVLFLVRKSHSSLRTICTREKSCFGIIENILPFCTLVPIWVLL
jgi:hypothetical protein